MRGRLIALAVLVGGGWAVWSGIIALSPRTSWSCDRWQPEPPEMREMFRQLALDLVRELQRDSPMIYGIRPRVSASWYGLRANAVLLLRDLGGPNIDAPAFTAVDEAHAGAFVREYTLVAYATRATGLPPCEINRSVPDAGSNSADEALARLERLVAILDGRR